MSAGQPVVLVTGPDLAAEALSLLCDYEVVYTGSAPSEAAIVELCAKYDPVAVILRYSRLGAAAMDAAPSLKVISKHGSGSDTIDRQAAAERGIAVRVAAGANAAAVAEHAIALLLACAKSVIPLDARMRTGHWDKSTHKSLELEGRTIGLIGLGAIGARVARIAQAIGMRVIGHDPYADAFPQSVEPASLDTIWRTADVISLHCPLTAESRQMINAKTLSACKPGVIIINTARGGLIDEQALLEAVRRGQVGRAGLDSFAVEPMTAGHPFQTEPRIILSPHVGGVTADAYIKMGVGAARNALSVLRGEEEPQSTEVLGPS